MDFQGRLVLAEHRVPGADHSLNTPGQPNSWGATEGEQKEETLPLHGLCFFTVNGDVNPGHPPALTFKTQHTRPLNVCREP